MSTQAPTGPKKALSRKDFQTDQDVRWCPGCGDYAILASIQKLLPELGVPRENLVVVSGIGCSSRFPYYTNTYGLHSIHGRAPTFATGLKIARPELSVWIVTGDGDGLSIGGNHLMHIIRRNIDVNILLFNNEIYGLTKGQTSPTSKMGTKTKSTPTGSVDRPVNPISFALGANATFVARSLDVDAKHLGEVLHRAHQHKGTSFVEILQNCNIFNDGAFDHIREKSGRADNMLVLDEGQPLVFGANRDKGIRIAGHRPEVVTLGDGLTEADLCVHSETAAAGYAFNLSELRWPEYPTPVGVFRAVEGPLYEVAINEDIEAAKRGRTKELQELVDGPETWTVH
jgi:2-oxoglutarate/2-oxoacid ferredoxin oxidoreductase subunit beta